MSLSALRDFLLEEHMSWVRKQTKEAKAAVAGWILFFLVTLLMILFAIGFMRWEIEEDQKEWKPIETELFKT